MKKKRAFEAGVDDYLVKPTNAEQITESMKKILKKNFREIKEDKNV